MERSLLLLILSIGGVVWLCGTLSAKLFRGNYLAGLKTIPPMWIGVGIALPVIVFLITMPASHPYFSEGHGLGTGFLVGGLAGLVSVYGVICALSYADSGDEVSAAAIVAAPIGLALSASVIPSIWLRPGLLDAECGIALGWLSATIVGYAGLASQWQTRVTTVAGTSMALSAAASALFCSLAGLGELRGAVNLLGRSPAILHWSAIGLTVSACLTVLLVIVTLPTGLTFRLPLVSTFSALIERGQQSDSSRAAARRACRFVFCDIIILIAARVVAARFAERGESAWKTRSDFLRPIYDILGGSQVFHVLLLGVIAAIVVTWITYDHARQTSPLRSIHQSLQPNYLGALVLVGSGMIAFQEMGGFGLCLILVILLFHAGLTSAGEISDLQSPSNESSEARTRDEQSRSGAAAHTARLLLFGCALGLYRVFSARFTGDLRGVGLTDHYALFGLLVGAALPHCLSAFYHRVSDGAIDSDAARLFRLTVTGLLCLAAPAVIVAFWGAKCALALLIGLGISTLLDGSILSALFALAIALAIAQWTHHLLPVSQLTRDQKIISVGWITLMVVLALVASEVASRLSKRLDKQKPPIPSGGASQ